MPWGMIDVCSFGVKKTVDDGRSSLDSLAFGVSGWNAVAAARAIERERVAPSEVGRLARAVRMIPQLDGPALQWYSTEH